MNKITKIFNNIGFYCSLNNEVFIDVGTIKSYQSLDHTSIGYYVPYLVRNLKDNVKWEIGVGEVVWVDNKVCVKRNEISSSSNSDKKVEFTGNANEFYLFVNNVNFNSSFNNVILKNDHFNIDNLTSIYLVDNSDKTIDCILPLANDARNVVVDVKALSNNHNIKIRTHDGEILSSTNDSIRLVSDGQSWYVLNNVDSTVNFGTLGLSDDNVFSSQSTPGGQDYSFQYKDGNSFVGSELYWSSGNSNELLLGSDSETNAHTIIPTSGSYPTIFNKDLQASDFIVYGSGAPQRNLFFSYDGRIGVNIPSGSRPQTIFHVVNYSCSEILRLENRTSCQPAKLTVFHKPSTLANNSICSILNLAGRDVAGNQKDYATIHSIAADTNSGLGEIVISVSSGNSPISLLSGNLNNVNLGYSNNTRLNINNNGNVSLSGSDVNVLSSNSSTVGTPNSNIVLSNNGNISLSQTTLNLGNGAITVGGATTFNNTVDTTNIRLPNIAPSSLLTLDNNNRIVAVSGINISSGNMVLNNISSNKLLSLDNNKNIVGLYDLNDYFLTERDIVWNKYSARTADVCLKQVTFDPLVPAEEFSIGDQVELNIDGLLVYRIIVDITFSDNNISGLLLDQNVTTVSVGNITIVSITKGGYLLMQKSTSGSVSDSTSNILSIRPLTETVFNTAQKDIDFTIYGSDTKPAFKVHANVGSATRASGIYHNFATRSDTISHILINSGGSGINNSFSTANYNYNSTDNLFSAKVSSVGTNGKSSYYGTFDQNGNVKEWLDSDFFGNIISNQLAAGGSFKTDLIDSSFSAWENVEIKDENDNIVDEVNNSINLRGIESLNHNEFYEDVGFRVASITNINDSFISNINLNFVNVRDSNNIADIGNIKINNAISSIPNLGVVDKDYRISTYEITNNQYLLFLNSVATGVNNPISSGLYHPSMSGSLGGINRFISEEEAEYEIKENMTNKPVNFVSYINSLRFINWLENGAPLSVNVDNLNNIINDGAYQILLADNNYYVSSNKNRKYSLPSLNQWHKAAYFEYKDSVVVSGSPVVTINTDVPSIVATEKITSIDSLSTENTENPRQILANLTVSGWLVVDNIIVRDGTIRSRLPTGFEDPDSPGEEDSDDDTPVGQSVGPSPPPTEESKRNKYWNSSPNVMPRVDGVYGEKEPPMPPNGTTEMINIDCANEELIDNNNVPFWCEPDGILKGPRFYP